MELVSSNGLYGSILNNSGRDYYYQDIIWQLSRIICQYGTDTPPVSGQYV